MVYSSSELSITSIPQAILDDDLQRKTQFIAELAQVAEENAAIVQADEDLAPLVAITRASVAILRGEAFDHASLT